jgi:hypothetical protein
MLPAGRQAAAQALYAYLSLGLCWDEYLNGILSFYRPASTREAGMVEGSGVFKARRIGGGKPADALVKCHKENGEVEIGRRQDMGNVFMGNN